MVVWKRTEHVLLALLVVACTKDRDADSGGPDEVFSELRCGVYSSVCATTTDGEIVCWGDGTALPPFSGELPSSPVEFDVQTSLCVLYANGELYCGSMANEVFDGGLVDFALGSDTDACALDADGAVQCSPFRCNDVTAPTTSFEQVVRTSLHACGLDAEGDLTCWGHFPESGCEDDGDVCSCQWSEPAVVASGYTALARGGRPCGLTAGGAIDCPWSPAIASSSTSFVYVDASLLVCGVSEDGTGECLTTRDLPDLEEVPADADLQRNLRGVWPDRRRRGCLHRAGRRVREIGVAGNRVAMPASPSFREFHVIVQIWNPTLSDTSLSPWSGRSRAETTLGAPVHALNAP